MAEERVQRRLAAILAADVVGYSRLMGADETGTRGHFNEQLDTVVLPAIENHSGRLVKTMGDGFLVEFGSVVEAVQCAVNVQNGVTNQEDKEPDDRKMLLRMGVHLGDVIVEGNDIHGDGVNIAARLEGLSEPGGICISDMVHAGVRNKLDIRFEGLGEQKLKNIADPIQVFRVVLSMTPNEATAGSGTMFHRPAVAVLPFENMSGDPDQEYFADGLTEDIITALSYWRSFPVIARNSVDAYKGQSPDIRKVGADLGARYVIEGSVRKAGNRIRVTAQLINAENGQHVWAEKLDSDFADMFELQDQLAARIVGSVAPELDRAEGAWSATKPDNLDAWDCVQRGFSHLDELTVEGNAKARAIFQRAIELDPRYSRAHSGLAYSLHRDIVLGSIDLRKGQLTKILEIARRAVELDEMDSFAEQTLGLAYYFSNQHDQALPHFERAVVLNPNNWVANRAVGQSLTLLGRPDESLPYLEKSFQLNPKDPRDHFYFRFMAWAHYTAHRYEEASDWARKSIQRRPTIPESHLILAASLGQLDRIEEGGIELDICERLQRGSTRRENWVTRYTNEADNDHLMEGLRKAGLLEKSALQDEAIPAPEMPSIAVLPFDNLSGDPEQEYFADGMVEEIITSLSRFNWLLVMARNSSFAYKGRAIDVRQIAEELGVRYVLEGSVRRADRRVRITGQLIDAATGAHIWADRFDGNMEDIFDLQDNVTASVVGAIEPSLRRAEIERSRRKRPESLAAYDLFLRALGPSQKMRPEANTEALVLLERAIEIDPGYAPALSYASWCYEQRVVHHWPTAEEADAEMATQLARDALAVDSGDAGAIVMAGLMLTIMGHDYDGGRTAAQRALALNPNSATICWMAGWTIILAGEPEDALPIFERALRLSPSDPQANFLLNGTAMCHLLLGRFAEALQFVSKSIALYPIDVSYYILASVCGHLGRTEEAETGITKLLSLAPGDIISSCAIRMPFRDECHLEIVLDGLRKGGWEG